MGEPGIDRYQKPPRGLDGVELTGARLRGECWT